VKTAEVLPSDGFALLKQFSNPGIIGKPMFEVSQEARCVSAMAAIGQGIVYPESLLTTIHKTCILEELQMLGNSRLGDSQHGLDLADAHHPFLQHFEKPYPVRIGQCLHDLDELLHSPSPYIASW